MTRRRAPRRADAKGKSRDMMHLRRPTALIAGAALLGGAVAAAPLASAQVNCDTMAGPAQADCQIGNARINQQKAAIAAGVARQRTDAAKLHRTTGTRPKATPARKALGN